MRSTQRTPSASRSRCWRTRRGTITGVFLPFFPKDLRNFRMAAALCPRQRRRPVLFAVGVDVCAELPKHPDQLDRILDLTAPPNRREVERRLIW